MGESESTPVERKSFRWTTPFSGAWDWIDKRDIDKHAVSVVVMLGTYKLTTWAMVFASSPHPGLSGTDIAAIIAAVTAPYMALQAAAIGFYFKARQ